MSAADKCPSQRGPRPPLERHISFHAPNLCQRGNPPPPKSQIQYTGTAEFEQSCGETMGLVCDLSPVPPFLAGTPGTSKRTQGSARRIGARPTVSPLHLGTSSQAFQNSDRVDVRPAKNGPSASDLPFFFSLFLFYARRELEGSKSPKKQTEASNKPSGIVQGIHVYMISTAPGDVSQELPSRCLFLLPRRCGLLFWLVCLFVCLFVWSDMFFLPIPSVLVTQ